MEQLTVRGLGDELARAIQRLANRDGTSLNRAAVKLLRQGAGLNDGQGPDTVGSSLDHPSAHGAKRKRPRSSGHCGSDEAG